MANLNDAQQGTVGTPSNTNRFVTEADPRIGGATGTVHLQATTPGTQQTGNANVSGAMLQSQLGVNTGTAPVQQVEVKLDADKSFTIDGSTNPRSGATLGAFEISGVAGTNSTRTMHIDTNANGYGDTNALKVEYIATALNPTADTAAISVVVDPDSSTGGEVQGIKVERIVNGGTLDVVAVQAGPGTDVVHQHQAEVTVSASTAFLLSGAAYTDVTATIPGSNVTLFNANNDYIILGYTTQFDAVQVVLNTHASNPGTHPTFEYSTGTGTWATFLPADGTDGFRDNGLITWTTSLLTGWVTATVNGVAGNYWVRIRRNQAGLGTKPISSSVKLIASVYYRWDKTGAIYGRYVNASQLGVNTGTAPAEQVEIKLDTDKSVIIDATTNLRTGNGGAVQIASRAGAVGTRSLNISVDANGHGDTHAAAVQYTATGFGPADDAAILDVQVNTAAATGGNLQALHVSRVGSGTLAIAAVEADQGVDPIHQHSAAATANASAAFLLSGATYSDVTATLPASNVTLFAADGDYLILGYTAQFSEAQVVLNTPASDGGISPSCSYSSGGGVWLSFTPNDGTNGFRRSGAITWVPSALSGWAVDTVNGVGGTYWIRIRRTKNSLVTVPISSSVKLVSSTDYLWDKSGDLSAHSLTLTTALSAANGGTGLTSPGTSGNVLTSNGTGWVSSAPPATGVTSVTASSPLASSGGATPNITASVGTTTGTLAAGDDARFGNATSIQSRTVASTAPAAGQALAWSGSQWAPAAIAPMAYPTDASDVLIYRFAESAAPYASTGSQALSLTTVGTAPLVRLALYGQGISPQAAGAVHSGNTSLAEPAYPVTLSLWVYLRSIASNYAELAKKAAPLIASGWVSPYGAIGLNIDNSGLGQWSIQINTGATPTINTQTVTEKSDLLQLRTWHHVGITYDGTTLRIYKDGMQVATKAVSGAINYGSHGPWMVGGNPNFGGYYLDGVITDVRLASVARDATWFLGVYQYGTGYGR